MLVEEPLDEAVEGIDDSGDRPGEADQAEKGEATVDEHVEGIAGEASQGTDVGVSGDLQELVAEPAADLPGRPVEEGVDEGQEEKKEKKRGAQGVCRSVFGSG